MVLREGSLPQTPSIGGQLAPPKPRQRSFSWWVLGWPFGLEKEALPLFGKRACFFERGLQLQVLSIVRYSVIPANAGMHSAGGLSGKDGCLCSQADRISGKSKALRLRKSNATHPEPFDE